MEIQALVIGASGGIGEALVNELETMGSRVTCLSRSHDSLDITLEMDVSEELGRLETTFDLVIVATGILSSKRGPEKSIGAVSAEEMANLFAVNAIGPAMILKHAKRLLPRDRRAVFAALSARVGSIGDNELGGWYSYRASKAALNQVIRTAAIEFKRTHKHLIFAALHPGTVATEFTNNYSQHKPVPPEQVAQNLLNVIDAMTTEDSGNFLDWNGTKVPW